MHNPGFNTKLLYRVIVYGEYNTYCQTRTAKLYCINQIEIYYVYMYRAVDCDFVIGIGEDTMRMTKPSTVQIDNKKKTTLL